MSRRRIAGVSIAGGHRVAYLVPNPRREEPGQQTMLRIWYAGEEAPLTEAQAMAHLRAAKRLGLTAWITDSSGRHIPTRGAMRAPPAHAVTTEDPDPQQSISMLESDIRRLTKES